MTDDPVFPGYEASVAVDGATSLGSDGVTNKSCGIRCDPSGPPSIQAGEAACFRAGAIIESFTGAATYDWDFGDGSVSDEVSPEQVF